MKLIHQITELHKRKQELSFHKETKRNILNFCRRGGLSRSRSTASTLNDSGVRDSINSILFHQAIRTKDPKQPKIHQSSNFNFNFLVVPPIPFQYRNEKCQQANKGLSWIKNFMEQQQLVGIFYFGTQQRPRGGRGNKNSIFKVSSSSASSLPPAAPSSSSSSFSSTVATPDPHRTASPVVTKVVMHFGNF